MKRLLFVKTGYAIKGIPAELRDFEQWTADAAGLSVQECETVAVIDGERLPPAGNYRCVIISGSAAMVTDRHGWSEYTAQWLLQAMALQVPILGICYGHQLLAHALGGVVDYHPRGREMGTKLVHCTSTAADDELFAVLPRSFVAHTTHLQSVTRLPDGAKVLAGNDFEPHHAVRFAPRAWGVQFHPEFTATTMTHYLQLRSTALQQEGFDVERLHAEVSETPDATGLLRRFVALAR